MFLSNHTKLIFVELKFDKLDLILNFLKRIIENVCIHVMQYQVFLDPLLDYRRFPKLTKYYSHPRKIFHF